MKDQTHKTLYLDCIGGLSGDMAVASLLDLGASLEGIRAALEGLHIPGLAVDTQREARGALWGTRFMVHAPDQSHHRHIEDIRLLLEGAQLPDSVRRLAWETFVIIAKAEGRVHGVAAEEVHFHEVGALDSIADIVAFAQAWHDLGVDRTVVSELPLGQGLTTSLHGCIPVPVPATLEILRGLPVRGTGLPFEMVTPTGAALARAVADSFGPLPPMTLAGVGVGVGSRQLPDRPNVVRALMGHTSVGAEEPVLEIQANLDDMNPQLFAPAMEDLFAAGAYDVWLTPIIMKQGRPAMILSALVPQGRRAEAEAALFRSTTTLGLRFHPVERSRAGRREESVATPYGLVRVKEGVVGGEVVNRAVEYGDCLRVAREAGVAVKAVWLAAMAAAHRTP